MVGQRAIQLRVVCAFLCPLPFLAPLARSATARSSEVRSQKSEVDWIAAFIGIPALFLLLPVRLFEIATPEWRPLGWIHAASVATLTLLYLWCVGGKRMGPPLRVPSGIFFRRSAMANSSGSSHHSGTDAHGRPCRRRNSDAPWNSCPSRGQPDSREHRARRRKRSVQRHPFIANSH